LYGRTRGVERDKKKEIYHLEQEEIGGHPDARYNLGCCEEMNDNIERAVKHYTIAANLGCDHSIEDLSFYEGGVVSKDDLAKALRAHQAAVDAMISPQREAAEAARGRRIVRV